MKYFSVCLFLVLSMVGGIFPLPSVNADESVLLYADDTGIWYMTESQLPTQWLSHNPTAYWQLIDDLGDNTVLLLNRYDDWLYRATLFDEADTFMPLVMVNRSFEVVVSADKTNIIYATGSPLIWYRFSLSDGLVTEIGQADTVLGCGSGVLQPDDAEYRNLTDTIFATIRADDTLLTSISCTSGLKWIKDNGGIGETTPEPTTITTIDDDIIPMGLNSSGDYLVGRLFDSIAVINATTGDLVAKHFTLGGYDRAWWLDDQTILFTTTSELAPYFPIQFTSVTTTTPMIWDETLADIFLNDWSPADEGLAVSELSLYRWNIEDEQADLLWRGNTYRAISDVVIQDNQTIWLEVIPSAMPLITALEQNLEYDSISAAYPYPRLIPLVNGNLQEESYIIGHSLIRVGG